MPDSLALEFRRAYFAAVSSMDRNVGLVLDKLDALGLTDSTIISFIGCDSLHANARTVVPYIRKHTHNPIPAPTPTCVGPPQRHVDPALTDFLFSTTASCLPCSDHGWQLGDLGEFGKKTNFERATRWEWLQMRSSVAVPSLLRNEEWNETCVTLMTSSLAFSPGNP